MKKSDSVTDQEPLKHIVVEWLDDSKDGNPLFRLMSNGKSAVPIRFYQHGDLIVWQEKKYIFDRCFYDYDSRIVYHFVISVKEEGGEK